MTDYKERKIRQSQKLEPCLVSKSQLDQNCEEFISVEIEAFRLKQKLIVGSQRLRKRILKYWLEYLGFCKKIKIKTESQQNWKCDLFRRDIDANGTEIFSKQKRSPKKTGDAILSDEVLKKTLVGLVKKCSLDFYNLCDNFKFVV
ncbi:hypothetical protein RFI_35472 [Reticulomyxa filosa]|uniref:Uncharacterized protein n=1 Tax=Reticulomyxa filosa TaxID=46433 RepID=X6LLG2_RETFI|nr:hypothetical protein RFI_35472 [Reticulomyxa filosa]|eukprot:ETO01967.1 hypothetical protein RFI_35472 [Reticulomyxa filosa]